MIEIKYELDKADNSVNDKVATRQQNNNNVDKIDTKLHRVNIKPNRGFLQVRYTDGLSAVFGNIKT